MTITPISYVWARYLHHAGMNPLADTIDLLELTARDLGCSVEAVREALAPRMREPQEAGRG